MTLGHTIFVIMSGIMAGYLYVKVKELRKQVDELEREVQNMRTGHTQDAGRPLDTHKSRSTDSRKVPNTFSSTNTEDG